MAEILFDIRELDQSWTKGFDNRKPVGSGIRGIDSQRWVRFHYLPDSSRIPTNREDSATILTRYQSVLETLTQSTPDEPIWVFTLGWSVDIERVWAERPAELAGLLPGAPWKTWTVDDVVWSVYATLLHPTDPRIATLLMDWVVPYHTPDVTIAARDLSWMFHPYDGGMDVLASTMDERDSLHSKYPGWLSPHPKGL